MKIALAACGGMSPNGLISRASVYDTNIESENTISICMGATSGDNPHLNELIKKYPIIAVNGCKSECVNTILSKKGVEVKDTVDIDVELAKSGKVAENTVRLNENDEECVSLICNVIKDRMDKFV